MKRLALVAVITVVTIVTAISSSINSQPAASDAGGYRWVKALDTGKPGWPRWIKPVAGPEGKLWMIAADGAWSTSDGVAWTMNRHNVAESVLPGVAQAFFAGKLWLMGGMKNWAEFTNRVSYSTDGTTWTVANAPWGPRRNAMTVVFEGKLWLLGGQISTGKLDQTPAASYHDVWNTSDGLNWTNVTSHAPWTGANAVVFDNRIWVFGNGESWSSANGRDWTRAAHDVAALRRGGNGCTVFDGKIWIYGGLPGKTPANDVWNSTDGIRWNLVAEHAPWFPRGAEYSIAFNEKLWIFGGKTGTHYKQADDIWFMSKTHTN